MKIFEQIRNFITNYVHFSDESTIIPLSFWIAATYVYEAFDSFPYMVITANTKRAGKTRLSELIGFTCQQPYNVTAASAASLMRVMSDNKPTIIWDEAETLSSEAGSLIRAFLNVGYRKGQKIMRASNKGVVEFPTYCPKVFVLIGEVYDTLRDRSIVVKMQRANTSEIKTRFSYENAKAEGNQLGEELKKEIASHLDEIQDAYNSLDISFLNDRDEEIWRPIFAICTAMDAHYFNKLKRIAVDMATEKTAPVKKYGTINIDAEERAVKEEYASKALSDLLSIFPKDVHGISSLEAVEKMREIDTAPWRKYLGTGLTQDLLADLFTIFNLRTMTIRPKGGRSTKVYRGYKREHVLAAAKIAGV